jgi:hypothetical protein
VNKKRHPPNSRLSGGGGWLLLMLWTRGTDAGAATCDCDAAVEERSTKTAMPFMYRTVVWAYDRISALFHRHACLRVPACLPACRDLAGRDRSEALEDGVPIPAVSVKAESTPRAHG